MTRALLALIVLGLSEPALSVDNNTLLSESAQSLEVTLSSRLRRNVRLELMPVTAETLLALNLKQDLERAEQDAQRLSLLSALGGGAAGYGVYRWGWSKSWIASEQLHHVFTVRDADSLAVEASRLQVIRDSAKSGNTRTWADLRLRKIEKLWPNIRVVNHPELEGERLAAKNPETLRVDTANGMVRYLRAGQGYTDPEHHWVGRVPVFTDETLKYELGRQAFLDVLEAELKAWVAGAPESETPLLHHMFENGSAGRPGNLIGEAIGRHDTLPGQRKAVELKGTLLLSVDKEMPSGLVDGRWIDLNKLVSFLRTSESRDYATLADIASIALSRGAPHVEIRPFGDGSVPNLTFRSSDSIPGSWIKTEESFGPLETPLYRDQPEARIFEAFVARLEARAMEHPSALLRVTPDPKLRAVQADTLKTLIYKPRAYGQKGRALVFGETMDVMFGATLALGLYTVLDGYSEESVRRAINACPNSPVGSCPWTDEGRLREDFIASAQELAERECAQRDAATPCQLRIPVLDTMVFAVAQLQDTKHD